MEATSKEELIAVHDRMIKDPAFQTELPITPPDRPEPDLGFLGEIFNAIGRFFVFIAPLLKVLLIVACVLLIAFIIYSIARAIYDRRERIKALINRGKQEDDLKNIDVRPDEHFARTLLSDADELARQGRFGEAIRLLLHSSIADMQERVKRRIGVSMTAREIGHLGSMPDDSRLALHRIIHTVEINIFGEQSVGEADYKKAREDYGIFAFVGGQS